MSILLLYCCCTQTTELNNRKQNNNSPKVDGILFVKLTLPSRHISWTNPPTHNQRWQYKTNKCRCIGVLPRLVNRHRGGINTIISLRCLKPPCCLLTLALFESSGARATYPCSIYYRIGSITIIQVKTNHPLSCLRTSSTHIYLKISEASFQRPSRLCPPPTPTERLPVQAKPNVPQEIVAEVSHISTR